MTTKEERAAEAERAGSNLRDMAEAIGMTPEDFFDAVKRQVSAKDTTAADFVALLHTAKQYGLDPLRKEVSLIPTKQGPRVYVTFDGWMRVLVSHPLYYNHGCKDEVWSGGQRGKGTLDAVTVWIEKWTPDKKTREVFEHTELLAECREKNDYTPWNKWPSRMLKEKCVMQATRFCFAMYVPDLDDVRQAEAMETAKAEAIESAPTQGPIAPAAPIPGAKRKKKDDAPAALPAPEARETIEDFLHGKAEPVPTVVAAVGPGGAEAGVKVGDVVPDGKAMAELISGPRRDEPATLPAFDKAESMRVDKALDEAVKKSEGLFDDIL